MKFIFQDVDGPLISDRMNIGEFTRMHKDWRYLWQFDPVAVNMLHELGRLTGAVIVWNTTWNKNLPMLRMACDKAGLNWDRNVFGNTQYAISTYDRLVAINHFLHDNPAERWVALDDVVIKHPNAILIDPVNGILKEDFELALQKLR